MNFVAELVAGMIHDIIPALKTTQKTTAWARSTAVSSHRSPGVRYDDEAPPPRRINPALVGGATGMVGDPRQSRTKPPKKRFMKTRIKNQLVKPGF
jgi:hypothetical protein